MLFMLSAQWSSATGSVTTGVIVKSGTRVIIPFTKADSVKTVDVWGHLKSGMDTTNLPLMGKGYKTSPIVFDRQDLAPADTYYIKIISRNGAGTIIDSTTTRNFITPTFSAPNYCAAANNLTALKCNIGYHLGWLSNSVSGTLDTVHFQVVSPVVGTDSAKTSTTHEYKTTRIVKGCTYKWYVVTVCSGVAYRTEDNYFIVPR